MRVSMCGNHSHLFPIILEQFYIEMDLSWPQLSLKIICPNVILASSIGNGVWKGRGHRLIPIEMNVSFEFLWNTRRMVPYQKVHYLDIYDWYFCVWQKIQISGAMVYHNYTLFLHFLPLETGIIWPWSGLLDVQGMKSIDHLTSREVSQIICNREILFHKHIICIICR